MIERPPLLHFTGTPAPLNMRPCSILELDATRCHWPLGGFHDAAMQFCGGAPMPGRRYCAYHLRLAHGQHSVSQGATPIRRF